MNEDTFSTKSFKIIRDQLSTHIKVKDGQVEVEQQYVVNICKHFINSYTSMHGGGFKNPSNLIEENEFCLHFSWFYNQLLFILLHCQNSTILANHVRKVLNFQVRESIRLCPKWLHQFLKHQFKIFEIYKSLGIDKENEIQLEFDESGKNPEFPFRTISVKSRHDLDFIACLLLDTLNTQLEVYSTSALITSTTPFTQLITTVFRHSGMVVKTAVLRLLSTYFAVHQHNDTIPVLNEIMESFSNYCQLLPTLINNNPNETAYYNVHFKPNMIKFFESMMSTRNWNCQFKSKHEQKIFVAIMCDAIFNEQMMSKQQSIPSMITKLLDVFDFVMYRADVEEEIMHEAMNSLFTRFGCGVSEIFPLLKYLIVLELEKANDYSRKVTELSESFNDIYQKLLAKLQEPHQQEITAFMLFIEWIINFMKMTLQSADLFTRRHQMSHFKGKNNCKNCMETDAEWNYQTIDLDFLVDPQAIVTAIITRVVDVTINKDVMCMLTDLFIAILQLSYTNSNISDEQKLFMLYVIFSPFLSMLSRNPEDHLPQNIVRYIENANESEMTILKKMVLCKINYLRLCKLGHEARSIVVELTQVMFLTDTDEVKEEFIMRFGNLLISNAEAMDELFMATSLPNVECKWMMCLQDKKFLVIKRTTPPNYSFVADYEIFCRLCETKLFKSSKTSIDYYATCMDQSNGHLYFLDKYDVKKKIEVDFEEIFDAEEVEKSVLDNFKVFVTHSANFPKTIKSDKLLNFILNEKYILYAESCFDIMIKRIIKSKDVTQDEKTEFFIKLYEEMSLRALNASRNCENPVIQRAYVNMIATYGTNAKNIPFGGRILIKDEFIVMKCLTSMMCFMFGDGTMIKGVAVEAALKMLSDTEMEFRNLIHWQQSLIMEDLCSFCIIDSIETGQSFCDIMANFLNNFGYLNYETFIEKNVSEIFATILPYCIENNEAKYLHDLAAHNNSDLLSVVAEDPFKVYMKLAELSRGSSSLAIFHLIENVCTLIQEDFDALLQEKKILCLQMAAIYYANDDASFRQAIAHLFSTEDSVVDWEEVIKFITQHFLGILHFVSQTLMDPSSDRSFKQMALRSIGKLLRFIGEGQTSEFCFKVMGLLKSTASVDINWHFKKDYIEIWEILIKLCNPEALKPFLSVIFVALEPFIKDFEKEVKAIAEIILVQNQNVMGRNIADLFFIDKTTYPDSMKFKVDNQLQSQCITSEVSFETNLMRLVRHMQSGNADSDVKNYCLQYLHDYTKVNREALNKIILDQNKKNEEVVIGDIFNILLDCCRKKSHRNLLIQTAVCFGEIGAINPSDMQIEEESSNDIGFDVHNDRFAHHVLNLICMDYKDLQNPNYIDYCGLGIQGILNDRKVLHTKHPLFVNLSTVNQLLVKPFIGSRFLKFDPPITSYAQIFWNQAQSLNDFAENLGSQLIGRIQPSPTRDILKYLIGCAKSSTEIASFVLPYIFLNYFQMTFQESEDMSEDLYDIDENIKEEVAYIFNVIENENDFRHRKDQKEFETKIMADKYFVPCNVERARNQSTNEFISVAKQIAKLIFEVFDFLTKYQISIMNSNERISTLLRCINKKTMARVAFNCGDYERALILFESHLVSLTEEQRESEWEFLVHIYAKIGDFDSIPGVVNRRKAPWSATERMFFANAIGIWESRSKLHGCIEEILHSPEMITPSVIKSTVNSLVSYNSCEESIIVADKMLEHLYQKCKDDVKEFEHVKTDALLRLSRFDELEKITENNQNDWCQIQANLCIKLHSGAINSFNEEIKRVRLSIMDQLKIFDSNKSIYSINYNHLVQLHMLTDIEKTNEAIQLMKSDKRRCTNIVKTLFDEINARKKFFKLTPMQSESLLALHRTLYKEVKDAVQKLAPQQSKAIIKSIDNEIGNTLLECVSILQNECVDNAILFLSEAEKFQPPGLFIQQAKIQWKTYKRAEQATKILKTTCDELEKLPDHRQNPFYAKGLLMIARYSADAANTDSNTNKAMYKKAMTPTVEQHKAYLYYGEYLDRVIALKYSMEGAREMDITKVSTSELEEMLTTYGNCLKYSVEYIFQALPRFLQIWLDGTTTRTKDKSDRLNDLVKTYITTLPTYQFYTAFSQLMARICHTCEYTYINLRLILSKLFAAYPKQSLWYMLQALKSKIKLSSQRTQEIIRYASRKTNEKEDFDYFISQLMEISRTTNTAVLTKYPDQINKALGRIKTRLLMPLQQNMQILNKVMMNNLSEHDQIFITRMDPEISTMRSLQKPRRLSFLCSDGLHHSMLLKLNDDLRIDFRFMEFCKVLNDYFRKDRDASLRCISVRTYYVSPITEEIGIIEWLNNMDTFKNIISEQFKRCNNPFPVKDAFDRLNSRMSSLRSVKDKVDYLEKLMTKFPPVLGRWYEVTFSNSQSYYNARQLFIRSVAVYSIVGYLFGIGDRHLENILIDYTTGQVAHVDFNLMFNKNETLAIPETVPFRLTQNMVQAMGVLGIEGSFRRCCEIIMRLLQRRKNVLISYLRPFVFDALKDNAKTDEPINIESLAAINNIKKKLDGLPRKYKKFLDIPLSSEGHVNFIIEEAISKENLAVMYFPWAPFV